MDIYKVETFYSEGFYIEKLSDPNTGEFKKFVTDIEIFDPQQGPQIAKAELKVKDLPEAFAKRKDHHEKFNEQLEKLLSEVAKKQGSKIITPSDLKTSKIITP